MEEQAEPGEVEDWKSVFSRGETRHYRVVDKQGRQIRPGIEILQYPVFLLRDNPDVNQEWIKLLTSAHEQGEEVLSDTSMAPAIHRAYELLAERNLPQFVKDAYYAQRRYLSRSSEQVAEKVAEGEAKGRAEGRAEGKAEGRIEIARTLKGMGDSVDKIVKVQAYHPKK